MVGRIVENLLNNAVRHTPPGTHVWVRLDARDGGAELAVDDDGPGVPDDRRESLFAAFERGPSANPQSPGAGVGLSLVARFRSAPRGPSLGPRAARRGRLVPRVAARKHAGGAGGRTRPRTR
jgi:K+-sensing histidine kinase KdpD